LVTLGEYRWSRDWYPGYDLYELQYFVTRILVMLATGNLIVFQLHGLGASFLSVMSITRYKPAQIGALLGKIKVEIANGKTSWRAPKARTPKTPG